MVKGPEIKISPSHRFKCPRSNLKVLGKYPEGISNLSHIVLKTPNGMAHLPLGRARCDVSPGASHFIPTQKEFGPRLKTTM